MTNEALFLHFDEELTSGRSVPTAYDENDLVFWLHFYSLFFDKLYIPANMFIDTTPCTLRALELCGLSEGESIIRMPDGPVTVLWDESRFPWNEFRTLFKGTASDPMWCTARNADASEKVANLCDEAHLTIIRADMTADLDPKESIAQLRTEVFSARSNIALTQGQLKRLQECLNRIEDRRDVKGRPYVYGRNFYYSVFGYGRTAEMRRLADRFTDITSDYKTLRPHFLTGVDYVSHSLKAFFASQALTKQRKSPVSIDVLMPDEYARFVCPPAIAGHPQESVRFALGATQSYPVIHAIDRNAIVCLKGKQLRELHESAEYLEYRAAIEALREPLDTIGETDRERAEAALNSYLFRIAVTLKPIRGRYRRLLNVAARAKYEMLGLAVVLLLLRPELPPGIAESASKLVELLVKMRYSNKSIDRIPTRSPLELPAKFRLGKDIRVYL